MFKLSLVQCKFTKYQFNKQKQKSSFKRAEKERKKSLTRENFSKQKKTNLPHCQKEYSDP